MPTDHRSRLAGIRRFDQLVSYLHHEMGWPIDSDDFEDLTFEYTPEELGIDLKNAAKIQEIKRLRPLTPNQPWGIFFVKFEPKRLPVVALRRILGQVALKKRASANKSERQAWAADDLLFVSNYGESGEGRRIAFAHFAKPPEGEDLPTLKVLGWDNLDTPLHLDDVADKLTRDLAWPADSKDEAAWRTRWRGAFTLRHREVVATSKELAIRLAELARTIRDRIKTALAIETEKGPLTKLMKTFQSALVDDLEPDGFADMYAQTIAYGLLSARIADPYKKTADDFAGHMRTNPFLRELMETFLKVGGRRGKAGGPGIDFDELGVSDVVELLDDANMESVVRDFGDRNPHEDPVIRFYEDFLREYDPKEKKQRGVFYTPRPAVSYIVRSVDELLRAEFGLVDGLADTVTWGEMVKRNGDLRIPEGVSSDQDFVQILDPATGTGTFLVEVIDLIHTTLVAKWKKEGHGEETIDALWNEYVPKHLLTRLHGYELLMAPYAIAHLKVGLKLYETGYHFGVQERARVYLTNALAPANDAQPSLDFLPALAHEAEAVNSIKRSRRFTVVIGNPPYSGVSANMSEDAQRLVDAYRFVDGEALKERKIWLQDDYVKFVRKAQVTIDTSGCGIVGYITNHGYVDNPTFRGMRQSLMQSFARLRVVDLHGNANKSEIAPGGGPDENIFDIRQGIAILLGSRCPSERLIQHADLWGARQQKYHWLSRHSLGDTNFTTLYPDSPYYLLEPQDSNLRAEYASGWSLSDIFAVYGIGMVTARDHLTIDFDANELWKRVQRFVQLRAEVAREEYNLGKDVQNWKVKWAQEDVKDSGPTRSMIRGLLYRPFDTRFVYYTGKSSGFICRPVHDLMRHMLRRENVALIATRSVEIGRGFEHVFCTRGMIQLHSVSLKETNYLFPLFTAPEVTLLSNGRHQESNISPRFVQAIRESLARGPARAANLSGDLTGERVLAYLYAILHSASYRRRYSDFLRTDFPRIPLPGKADLFQELVRLGVELLGLHLLESQRVNHPITEFLGSRSVEVDKVSWSENTVWLNREQTAGFRGVSEEVWNYHIGGYRVREKWLKDRKGCRLSNGDVTHYQRIIVALFETIRLMKEIDELIEMHGGWPQAFRMDANAPRAEVVQIPKKAVYKKPAPDAHELPLLKAAEPASEYKPENPGGKGNRSPRRR